MSRVSSSYLDRFVEYAEFGPWLSSNSYLVSTCLFLSSGSHTVARMCFTEDNTSKSSNDTYARKS